LIEKPPDNPTKSPIKFASRLELISLWKPCDSIIVVVGPGQPPEMAVLSQHTPSTVTNSLFTDITFPLLLLSPKAESPIVLLHGQLPFGQMASANGASERNATTVWKSIA